MPRITYEGCTGDFVAVPNREVCGCAGATNLAGIIACVQQSGAEMRKK